MNCLFNQSLEETFWHTSSYQNKALKFVDSKFSIYFIRKIEEIKPNLEIGK